MKDLNVFQRLFDKQISGIQIDFEVLALHVMISDSSMSLTCPLPTSAL